MGDEFRADWPVTAPVLLVNGDLDWSTPLENAQHLRRHLKHGHLIEVEGGTHCDESPEMDEALPQEMERINSFIDADFEHATPEAFFAMLPQAVAYPPIRFSPPAGPSLYDHWLKQGSAP